MTSCIYTFGHSNHTAEAFVSLLRQHGVTAVADVRSQPYSRLHPQFNREPLKAMLQREGFSYVFLGKELGARSEDPACYRQGKLQFSLLARHPLFLQGLERLRKGMESHAIAIMCAERDPLNCHRTILVSRQLRELGIPVMDILADGALESHEQVEKRLLALTKLPDGDLFRTRDECIAEAYGKQGERISYEDDAVAERE